MSPLTTCALEARQLNYMNWHLSVAGTSIKWTALQGGYVSKVDTCKPSTSVNKTAVISGLVSWTPLKARHL